jgi:hypothetical protein
MSRATDRSRARKDAEERFSFKVDMRVLTYGETWPFVEMLAWCRDNVAKAPGSNTFAKQRPASGA